MASTSVSHMIWFIVAVIIAVSTALAFAGIAQNFVNGLDEVGKNSAGAMATDVKFINDPATVRYDNTTKEIFFYIKNTGSYRIHNDSVALIINGNPLSGPTLKINVIANGPELSPGAVIELSGVVLALTEDVDYYAWVSVNGMDHGGYLYGSAEARIHFRIDAV